MHRQTCLHGPRHAVVIAACLLSACDSGQRAFAGEQPAMSPLVAAARRIPAEALNGSGTAAVLGTALGQSHEQEWIVADVLTTLFRLARPTAPTPRFRVTAEDGGWSHDVVVDDRAPARLPLTGHVWSIASYLAPATNLLGAGPVADDDLDLDVRTALTDLTAETLIAEDRRISTRLRARPRSAAAHEAAALLVGAFALREGLGPFADTRREMSLMTAHLVVAQAVRGLRPETRDGQLARAIHATLVGLERDALTILRPLLGPTATAADRAWVRALTLRNTGDWRTPLAGATATRLEAMEYARALATRRGSDAALTWFESFEQDTDVGWHRVGFSPLEGMLSLEGAAVHTEDALDREVAEATQVWSALHDGRALPASDLIDALNERDDAAASAAGAPVLPWTRWAAAGQRHIGAALSGRARYHRMRGDPRSARQLVADSTARFERLTLFPLALRSMALDAETYGRSMAGSRQLLATHPDLVTAGIWNLLAERPRFSAPVETFPVLPGWMYPIVPTGTAYDLYQRALYPGCPRTPPNEQVIGWAKMQPHNQWTISSSMWLPDPGVPDASKVIAAYGTLLEYDANANRLVTFELDASVDQNLLAAQRLCQLSGECGRHAWLLLWDGRESEAAAAYEAWMASARDTVSAANELSWLARHYLRVGRKEDALRVALYAGSPGSSRGLSTLAETLVALGHADEGLAAYQAIESRYAETEPLATHRFRLALAHGTRDDQMAAMTALQGRFPHGIEPLVLNGLDATPKDGVTFGPLGRRALAIGVRPGDIVVGVDEWRVRTADQYSTLIEVRHTQPAVTLTVFRDGRYQRLALQMPERRLAVSTATFARQP